MIKGAISTVESMICVDRLPLNEGSLLSTSKLYALKKRCILPTWLVEGILMSLGHKEPWAHNISSSYFNRIVACPQGLHTKIMAPLFSVWNEIILSFCHSYQDKTSIKIKLNNHLIGTSSQIQELAKELCLVFSQPLKIQELKVSKRSRGFQLHSKGFLNFVRQAGLTEDCDGIYLNLQFTTDFKTFCFPSELNNVNDLDSSHVVTLSPLVIKAMGSRVSLKKMLNYIFLEANKQKDGRTLGQTNSFYVDVSNISAFHKDFLSMVSSLYDHGVLGWTSQPPAQKLSEMKKKLRHEGEAVHVVCVCQLSDQVFEAVALERQAEASLFSFQSEKILLDKEESLELQPLAFCSQLSEPKEVKKPSSRRPLAQGLSIQMDKTETRPPLDRQNYFGNSLISRSKIKTVLAPKFLDDGIVLKKRSEVIEDIHTRDLKKPTKKEFSKSFCRDLTDHEFLILVSEFYESLKPLQRKAFERDRKGMTKQQFKAYMSSILQRKKSAQYL